MQFPSYDLTERIRCRVIQITLTAIWLWQREASSGGLIEGLSWAVCCMAANLVVCVFGWWRCFSNNYLYWASIFTWLLINSQGEAHAIRFDLSIAARNYNSIIITSALFGYIAGVRYLLLSQTLQIQSLIRVQKFSEEKIGKSFQMRIR